MLILEGVELIESVLRRFGDGSSGVVGVVGEEEAAALCINFMVKSREDIDFGGVGAKLPVADILATVNTTINEIDRGLGPVLLLLVFICPRAQGARMSITRGVLFKA